MAGFKPSILSLNFSRAKCALEVPFKRFPEVPCKVLVICVHTYVITRMHHIIHETYEWKRECSSRRRSYIRMTDTCRPISVLFYSKGHQLWRFNSSRKAMGRNPQNISAVFPRIPSNIDAAFFWSANGKLYFIKGSQMF